MKTNIGISEKHRHAVAQELNKVLADEYVLFTKTRNYHWNVEGPSFIEMHKFYESQSAEIDEIIDAVAERIRALGYYSNGRLEDFISTTQLDEPGYTSKAEEQLKNLLEDHEAIIRNMRTLITTFAEDHIDLGSSDFITGLMERHEKMAWFLRSHLSGTEGNKKEKELQQVKYEH
jgi:starvation-inducible DNA-binding protein